MYSNTSIVLFSFTFLSLLETQSFILFYLIIYLFTTIFIKVKANAVPEMHVNVTVDMT